MANERLPQMKKICLDVKKQCSDVMKFRNMFDEIPQELLMTYPTNECEYHLPQTLFKVEPPNCITSACVILNTAMWKHTYLLNQFELLNKATRYFGKLEKSSLRLNKVF